MEKERKVKTLSLVALIVAVLGLTVAFAALSQTLTINNNVYMAQDNWDVRIQGSETYYEDKSQNQEQSFSCVFCNGIGMGKTTLNVGENWDTLQGFEFNLKKPGDYGLIWFAIANYGEVDAKLASIIDNKPVCTSDTGNEEDEELVCDNLIIKYGYINDKVVSQVGWADTIDEFKEGDVVVATGLNSNGFKTKNGMLYVELDSSLDKIPTSNVTVSNLGFKLNYIQK